MALPKQVQDQADAVAEWDRQQAEANKPPTAPAPTEPIAVVAPVVTEPVAPPAAPVEPPKPPVVDEEAAKWKHKYQTIQGMYNSHVPQLQNKVKQLGEDLEKALRDVEALKTATKPAVSGSPTSLVTPKDEEAFGKDLVDLARRIAVEQFAPVEERYQKQITELTKKLESSVQEVTTGSEQTAFQTFLDRLSIRLPSWQQIQETPECQEWLSSRVPGTDFSWDAALKDAAKRKDVEKALEVFSVFFQRYPQLDPNKKPAPAPAPAPSAELQRQVSPNKSGSAAPTAAPNRRFYTSREYEQESMRQMRLEQHGRTTEAKQIEAELNAALAEGRITN